MCVVLITNVVCVVQVLQFSVAEAGRFELSSRKSHFESGEEIQLLYQAMEDASYDQVGVS